MSGRGRNQGPFRNQRGFQRVRGSSSPTSASIKKSSRASNRNDIFTGGGSPSTRSATSPSLRTRSLTPASDSNVNRSSGKYRNTVVGGRLSLGRSGKGESKSSLSSIAPTYSRQNSSNSSSSRSGSPDSRKRKMEMSATNAKKRLTGKPKFQDNPSAPEIVDCNQSNRDVDLNSSFESGNDAFIPTEDTVTARGDSDDESDTDNESCTTEPTADNNVPSVEENDIATNSTVDEDSLAENERYSSHHEQESPAEDESISSVSDIISDAVFAFFNKEQSMNKNSNEENDISPINESSPSKAVSRGDEKSPILAAPSNEQYELKEQEKSMEELSRYIHGKLVSSSSVAINSKMDIPNLQKFKEVISSLVHEITSVSKTFNGKPLLDSYHSVEFVENMINKFFLSDYSAKFMPDEQSSSNGNCDENFLTSFQNGNANDNNLKIEVSNEFITILSKFVSIELKNAFIAKESRLGRDNKVEISPEVKQGAINFSDLNENLNANTESDPSTGNQRSKNDCMILQEIDAASAVSAVTGLEIMNNHCAKSDLDTKAMLDKNRLITEMEDKFARETNSALKKRPVYKKHGNSDTTLQNGQKKNEHSDLEKLQLSSTLSQASDSMILDVRSSKKNSQSLVGTDLHNQNSVADALIPQNITNGSSEHGHELAESNLKHLNHEASDSTNCNSAGIAKSLRKVRVKRGKEKADDENYPNITEMEAYPLTLDTTSKPFTNSHEGNSMPQVSVKRNQLSPALCFQTSPRKPNQGPRRYYEQTLENNFILAPTILSKADAEQSTVALFKIPTDMSHNHPLNFSGPDESSETQIEKYLENDHTEPTKISSLKTVIRLPKIGSKKKGKRRLADEETETPGESAVLSTQQKRFKNKISLHQSGQSNNSNSLGVDNFEFVNDSPSPEPVKINRLDDSSTLPDNKHTNLDSQVNSNDEKLQGMMVVPEKASSFSIHSSRCCYDVCQYCGLKFGMLDTPMHVSQLKTVELQKFAVEFTKFKADACLCDKCFRYIDRKARNAEINRRNRVEDVEQEEGDANEETTVFGLPFHKTCFIRNCNKEVTTTIGKKWLLRLKKKLIKRGTHLDWERVNKSSLKTNFPLCNKHNTIIDHYVHCGLCKRKLTIGGMCSLGISKAEVQALNELLQKDGIPAALVENQFVCKLCTTFCGIGQKSIEPNYFKKHKAHKSFYKDYRKRLHSFLGVEHYSKSEDSNTERGGTTKIHQVSSERNNPIKITIKTSALGPSYIQENNTKSVRKRKVKENGLKGEKSKSHRGLSPETSNTSINANSKRGDGKSDDDMEVTVKEKHSKDKCSISVHFDHNTKKLWQDLHHPYGNYSSFFRHLLLLEKYWRNGDLKLSDTAREKSSNYIRSVQNRINAYEVNHKRSDSDLSTYTRPSLSDPAQPTCLHTLESTLDVFSGPMQRSPILASASSGSEVGNTSTISYPPNVSLSPSYNKSPSKSKLSSDPVCDPPTVLKVPKISVREHQPSSIVSTTSVSTPTVNLTISKSPDIQQISPQSLPTKIRVRTDLMHLGLMEKQKVEPSPNLMAANPETEFLRQGLQGKRVGPVHGTLQGKNKIEKHDLLLQPSITIAVTNPKTGPALASNNASTNSIDKYRTGQSTLMDMLNDPPLKVIVPPSLKQVDKDKSIISALSNPGVTSKLTTSSINRAVSSTNLSLSNNSAPLAMTDGLVHTPSSNKHLFQNCSNSGSSAIPLTFNNSIAEVLAAAKKAKEQSVSPNKLSNILKGGSHSNTLPKPDVTITAKSISKTQQQSSTKGAEAYSQKQSQSNKSSNSMNISFQHFLSSQNAKNLGASTDLSTSSAATLAELQKSATENANRLYNEAINNPLLDMNKLLHTQPPAVAPHLVAQNSLSNIHNQLGSSAGITIPIIPTSTTVAGINPVSTITSKQYTSPQQQQQSSQQQMHQPQANKKNINNILDRLSVMKSNSSATSTQSFPGLSMGDASTLANLTQQQLRTSTSISPKSNESIRKSVTADFTSGGVTASPANNLVGQSQAQQNFNSELSLLLGLAGPATSLGQLNFPMSSLTGNTSVTATSSSRTTTQSTQNQAAAVAAAQNQAQQAAQAALLMAGAGLPGMNQVAAAAAMQELMKISLTQQQLQPGMTPNANTNAQVLTSALTQQLQQQMQNEANQKQQATIQSNAIANSKAIQSLRLRAPPPLTHMGKGGGSSSNQSTKPT